MNYTFKEVQHNTEDYLKTVALRDKILRQPLGLVFTEEQLAAEDKQTHLACFGADNEVIGCLVLVFGENGERCKMRQLAVHSPLQRQGIGQKLVTFSEDFAKNKGCSLMYFHARDTAVSFYQKMNYQTKGDVFQEVGVDHFFMEKIL